MPESDELLRELSRRERQIMDFLYQKGRAILAEGHGRDSEAV